MQDIKAVVIHSKGEIVHNHVPQFTATTISEDQFNKMMEDKDNDGGRAPRSVLLTILEIDVKQEKFGWCPIGEKLGFPLFITRHRFDDSKKGAWNESLAGTRLRICVNPEDEKFGWAPLGWSGHCGTTLVVRKDKKSLYPEHVEVLCDLCTFIVDNIHCLENREAAEEMGNGFWEKQINNLLSKDGFKFHWEKYRATKAMVEEHEDWRKVPSPYEV